MKNGNKSLGQWLSLLLLGIALVAVYKMFDSLAAIVGWIGQLFSILTPFVAGFVIAFLLYTPAKRIEEFLLARKAKFWVKGARPLSVAAVYLMAVAVLAAIVGVISIAFRNFNILDFVAAKLPAFISDTVTSVENFLATYTKPGGFLENFDISAKIQEIGDAVLSYFTTDRIMSYVLSVVNFTTSIVDVILSIIVSVYMLLGRESLFRAVRAVCGLIFKPKRVDFLGGYMQKIATIFHNYVYSQLIDAAVVSVLATIGLLLAGLGEKAPALGIMLGFMNMIPYFGAIIGGVICALVALFSNGLYSAIFVGVYILVMQQIDGNILQPRIIGHNVGLKAIYVLLGITVGGGLFGFWGILLGAPCMAVLQMILTEYIAYRNREKALAASPENAPPTE